MHEKSHFQFHENYFLRFVVVLFGMNFWDKSTRSSVFITSNTLSTLSAELNKWLNDHKSCRKLLSLLLFSIRYELRYLIPPFFLILLTMWTKCYSYDILYFCPRNSSKKKYYDKSEKIVFFKLKMGF